MSPVVLVLIVLAGVAFVAFTIVQAKAELARRTKFFDEAQQALGWGPFHARKDGDGQEAEGSHDGARMRFAVDRIVSEARVDAPLPKGTNKGAVFDLIIREGRGALESGSCIVGFDDEHDLLLFRTSARDDAKTVVKTILDEVASFRKGLPERLKKAEEERRERRSKIFGEFTAKNGKHAKWGIGLALPPDDWELVREKPEALAWEHDGDLPIELRLIAAAQDPALAEADARARLIGRIAHAYAEGLPDGSFEAVPDHVDGEAAADVGGFKSATAHVDFAREVVVKEEETDARPYRHVVRAVFAPWAVLVLEVTAPKEQANGLVARLVGGATFEDPAKFSTGAS